jgi:hypothetical protein
MRYRPLSATGDYTFGRPFLANSPDCVAQAILTRLKLWRGEFFLDTTDGTAYLDGVLGKPYSNPDAIIKQRILSTPGVRSITSYSSAMDGNTRALTITATVDTIYGPATISEVL